MAELAVFDKVPEKSKEFEEALKAVKEDIKGLIKLSDPEKIDEAVKGIEEKLNAFTDIFSAKQQLENRLTAMVAKSEELNALTDSKEIEAKYQEIMNDLKEFYIIEKDKVKKPDLDAL